MVSCALGVADAGCLLSDAIAAVATGVDRGGISPGDGARRVLVEACRWLRNRRHVSELFVRSFAVVVTAGFAPKALLVSSSS
jgi:hypothetical protein